MWVKSSLVIFHLGVAGVFGMAEAHAQNSRIALKSGESVELGQVYWVARCRSIMVGTPAVEVLEGPEEVTLAIKEGMVLPRRLNCANEVPGGKSRGDGQRRQRAERSQAHVSSEVQDQGWRPSDEQRLYDFALPVTPGPVGFIVHGKWANGPGRSRNHSLNYRAPLSDCEACSRVCESICVPFG